MSSKRTSRSAKGGLLFSVGRIDHHYCKNGYSKRMHYLVPVYLAAVLEYLVSEVLELAVDAARASKKKTIHARPLQLAIRNDIGFNNVFRDTTIADGDTLPKI
ncbi:histone-fold-containing protein [Backusella circina FSU 941]|nr:histone-fold-containing protein [Backusella circina FSU 941]